ncbi:XRE family transcriptional regulator [Streptomyces sp. 8K308]|uniref:helix-turn-helix transcriptional regulator n=1 Tax=Streptomyces sp. 8K308 TaxID=2530388 RepID=UPI00104E4293|nr:helix-turn-helix transcriptional regulator [Streptomyces sp. 8K308]TDC24477.1 XRE family transcriptional regulator [Streptomyces sp. 8K308]
MTSTRPSPKAKRPLGYLLKRAREARDLTQAEFARRLRHRSVEAGRPLGTGRDGVCHWEKDRTPDRPTQQLIADELGIPRQLVDERPWPQWLADDPAQRPAPLPWTLPGAAQALNDITGGAPMDVTRRELVLISGGTLTASLLAWLTADPVAAGQMTTGQRIGEAAVARIEERVRSLWRLDDADGGGAILPETASALALVNGLLRTRSYSDEHRARLYAAAADLGRQRAAATFDIHGECADGMFETALRAAKIAGDDALGANVLAFWATAARNTDRPQDAEAMASAGLAAVRGRSTLRVQSMFASHRGRARAKLGDDRCWADLERADELLAEADNRIEDDPAWTYWYDRPELLASAASSHHNMGQLDQASATFDIALASFPHDRVRDRMWFLTRQADVQFQQGEIERAVDTANRALDLAEDISSRRSAAPLLDLADQMITSTEPSARDFHERARTVLVA